MYGPCQVVRTSTLMVRNAVQAINATICMHMKVDLCASGETDMWTDDISCKSIKTSVCNSRCEFQ